MVCVPISDASHRSLEFMLRVESEGTGCVCKSRSQRPSQAQHGHHDCSNWLSRQRLPPECGAYGSQGSRCAFVALSPCSLTVRSCHELAPDISNFLVCRRLKEPDEGSGPRQVGACMRQEMRQTGDPFTICSTYDHLPLFRCSHHSVVYAAFVCTSSSLVRSDKVVSCRGFAGKRGLAVRAVRGPFSCATIVPST